MTTAHYVTTGRGMDDRPIDPFDDLFEPFDIESGSGGVVPDHQPRRTVPVRTDDPLPLTTAENSGIACPACGTINHVGNRHCDSCGARLTKGQMPVAPQPMLRTTAGARALIVLAGVVLAVALLALVFNIVGGGPEETTTTTGTDTTLVTGPEVELFPIRVECTSELETYPCTALIDGDDSTSWNATEQGLGVELTFFFQPAVQITQMWMENLQDECRFLRNARIRAVEVEINDRPQLHIQNLEDTNLEPQRITLNSIRTSTVVVKITNSYVGTSCDGQEAFNELALQSVTFFGRVAPGE